MFIEVLILCLMRLVCFTETLALYSLRKYRHLKRMYPDQSLADPFHNPPPTPTPAPKIT